MTTTTDRPAFASKAPALDHTLRVLRETKELGRNDRAALLALAALADQALHSPDGLTVIRPHYIAGIVGGATATVTRTLRVLAGEGLCVMVINHAALRLNLTGPDAAKPLQRGNQIVGFRPLPEVYS